MPELQQSELEAIVGWFISGYEDKTYPPYTGPGDPHEGHNPRYDAISELRSAVGIDITESVPRLIEASDNREARYGD